MTAVFAAMAASESAARLLVALAAVVAVAHLGGLAARALGQPAVLGQIAAGIMSGPSLAGAVAPGVVAWVLAPEVMGGVRSVGQVGLVLFMFLVGRDVDPDHVRGAGRRAVVISQVSIVVPFGLGAVAATWIHRVLDLDGEVVPFVLFVGIAMSITAFPVLARILQEVGLDRTRVGGLALTCAAVDDVTAWCALAVVVAVSGAGSWASAVGTVVATVGFSLVMLGALRPLARRLGPPPLPVAVAVALAAAYATERIGIHAIFGAFLAGVALGGPADGREDRNDGRGRGRGAGAADPVATLEPMVTGVLLPAFFVVVGASTRLGSLDRPVRWLVLAVVLVVAVAGKLGGTTIAARLVGEDRRTAWTLGVLLNTRGLTEIVILTVGLDLGIIDATMFTIMVVMALVTTFVAGPLLRRMGATVPPGQGSPDRPATLVPPDALE